MCAKTENYFSMSCAEARNINTTNTVVKSIMSNQFNLKNICFRNQQKFGFKINVRIPVVHKHTDLKLPYTCALNLFSSFLRQ